MNDDIRVPEVRCNVDGADSLGIISIDESSSIAESNSIPAFRYFSLAKALPISNPTARVVNILKLSSWMILAQLDGTLMI